MPQPLQSWCAGIQERCSQPLDAVLLLLLRLLQ